MELQTSTGRAMGASSARGASPAVALVTAPPASKTPVLVFGTSITALGVIRVFRRKGRQVFVHSTPNDLVTLSKYYKPISLPVGFDRTETPSRQLIQILEALPFERAVLFACTDLWAEAVAALPEELAKRFVSSHAPPETISILLDKGKLAHVMSQLDLPHPRSIAVESRADLEALGDGAFESAFFKPLSSARFIEKFKVKAIRVANRTQALERFDEIRAQGFRVFLQEYIPGPPTEHYFIDGFMDRGGRICARLARQRLRMYPVDFGNSTYMATVAIESVQPAMDALERLLIHLHYRGIFSAEFKRDPRDGIFRLLEVNVRPWWYIEFAEACGAPVCEMAYADALGLPMPTMSGYPVGRRCVYPYFDLEGYFWHKRMSKSSDPESQNINNVSLAACVGSWLTSRQPIFAWDDLRPALSNFWFLCKRFLKNQLRRKTS